MKKLVLLAVMVGMVVVSGCGGGSITSKPTAASVSEWAGTYVGTINFNGCPSAAPCGGDSITLTIADSADSSHPGEFLATITASGMDSTLSKTFSANGTVLYAGAAPVGPGNTTTTGAIYFSNGLGGDFFMTGSGASTTSSPVLIDTIALNALVMNGATATKGSTFYGMLTRKP